MTNILEFVKKYHLGKWRKSGDQLEIGCPFDTCPNSGEPQFYISINTEAWYCHRCNKKGANLKRLAFSLGYLKLQEPVKATHIIIPDREVEGFKVALNNNEEALHYLRNNRGLEDWTIRQFQLGMRLVEQSPVIVIPYFNQHQICVGLKYDHFTRPIGVPKYTWEKNSKKQFYNLDNIDLKQPLAITEGEYDAISGFQYGIKNIGSIPNGAQGINGWVEEISGGEKYILCFDNDSAGQEGSEKLGKALGKANCFRVYPRVKDLSEAAQIGLEKKDVEGWFKEQEPMFQAPIMDITSYKDKAVEVIDNPNIYRGISTGWNVFDFYLGGIRWKEVTVISGKTGNGKTTFGMSLVSNLMKRDINCLVVSPEMREERLLLELANNQFRKQVDKEELDLFIEHNQGKILLANVYGSWTDSKDATMMESLFDIMQYAVKNNSVKFIFIDHMRLFTSVAEDKERKDIDAFMKKCVRFSMIHDVHVCVVVQPRKLEKGQRKVTSNDLKGSVNIEQDAHNILLVHREENSDLVEFDLSKNRELGTVGNFKLKFNKESMANYDEIKQ
jgi:twinkle protein